MMQAEVDGGEINTMLAELQGQEWLCGLMHLVYTFYGADMPLSTQLPLMTDDIYTTWCVVADWLCGTVLGLWPKGCELNPGSRQLLGERGSTLSLILAELCGL